MSEPTVMSGAEPFHFEGSDTGVLLSHSFTGTTQSMRYLAPARHSSSSRATTMSRRRPTARW